MGSPRNYLLDGLRGIAALAVACYHAGFIVKQELVPGGYLAVDFFFVLSGFVIDRAYRRRIDLGLTPRQFMIVRLYRLYPLFVLGVLLGVVRLGVKVATHQLDMTVGKAAVATLFNIVMLPVPFAYKNNFPLNSPAWSLFCEMVLNLVFAVALVRATRLALWLVVIGGAVAMVIGATTGDAALNLGWRADTLGFGLARATFGFTFGMVLARWLASRPAGAEAGHIAVPTLLLILALVAPVPQWLRPAFDLAFAFVVAPSIVVLGARAKVPPRFNPSLYWLGILSYPLYALHFPVFQLANGALGSRLPPVALAVALVAAAIGAAMVAERFIDVPARRRGSAYLGRVTGGRQKDGLLAGAAPG